VRSCRPAKIVIARVLVFTHVAVGLLCKFIQAAEQCMNAVAAHHRDLAQGSKDSLQQDQVHRHWALLELLISHTQKQHKGACHEFLSKHQEAHSCCPTH